MKQNSTMISIIVPVYNVEAYLCKCVESLIVQTYDNYEVILVDDGSTDSSGEICNQYAKRYGFISVIHQNNRGLSGARNSGFKKSEGELITFVDSDDYVSEDYLMYLYTNMSKSDADISIGRLCMFWGDEVNVRNQTNDIILMKSKDALETMLYRDKFGVTACCKLYKKEKHFCFPEGVLYEDLATTYKLISDSKYVVYGSKAIYFYRQRKNSIRHGTIDEAHMYGIKAAEEQMNYISVMYPDLRQAAEFRVALIIFELISKTINWSREGNNQFVELRNCLMKYRISVLNNHKVKPSMKVRCIATLLGYYPSCIVFGALDLMAEIKVRLTL